MVMLKKVCILTFVCCFAFSAMALAKISNSRIGLGGIAIGNTVDYVKQIYGEPQASKRNFFGPYGEYAYSIDYGDSFHLQYFESDGMIFIMYSNANNGIKTPDGITVGDKASILQRVYGTADIVQRSKNGEVHYWYLGDKNNKMVFHTKNGIITAINCGFE